MREDGRGVLKTLTCSAGRVGEAVMADAGQVEPKLVEEAEEGGGLDMDDEEWESIGLSVMPRIEPRVDLLLAVRG